MKAKQITTYHVKGEAKTWEKALAPEDESKSVKMIESNVINLYPDFAFQYVTAPREMLVFPIPSETSVVMPANGGITSAPADRIASRSSVFTITFSNFDIFNSPCILSLCPLL